MKLPFSSTTLKATIAPFLTSPLPAANPATAATEPPAGANTQRVPAASCQLANDPVAKSSLENAWVVASTGPFSAPASSSWILLSLVATAIRSLSLYSKTSGEELNALPAL